jgi:hypothetical protein
MCPVWTTCHPRLAAVSCILAPLRGSVRVVLSTLPGRQCASGFRGGGCCGGIRDVGGHPVVHLPEHVQDGFAAGVAMGFEREQDEADGPPWPLMALKRRSL